MRYFILVYNGLLWGLLAAVLATRSLWLDMRINAGLIIPVVILMTIIAGLIANNKLRITPEFTLVNLVFCFTLIFFVLGIKRLAVIPASIIRESINMSGLSFSFINWVLIIFLTLGLIIILTGRAKSK
jgi:hypothetical protein